MAISKLYYFTNPNFQLYIVDEITMSVKDIVFREISKTKKELKYILKGDKKKEKIESIIKELKGNVDLEVYTLTDYKISMETDTFFINDLLDIIEKYPDKNSEGYFTILMENRDVFGTKGKNPSIIEVELFEETEMFEKLYEIKKGLVENISQYILLDYWLFEINNLSDLVVKKIADLSDSKGTEKIIMLDKLGILDILRSQEPFNMSVNALSSAISGITGIKQVTVQSYLNPIINPNADQKNNPLKVEKTVVKVEDKLSSIGFIPSK